IEAGARGPAARPMTYRADKRLARRILAGDQAAFRLFFDEYFRRLYRFALARVGNDDACQEVVQLTFTKALERLASYRGEAQLYTWLCAICRNVTTDWLRQQGRYRDRVVAIDDHPEFRAAIDSLRAPDSDSPDAELERAAAVRLIQIALDRLPAHYGDALEWKYIEGHTVAEIAGRLELGREAAQSLLARARRAFADVYTDLLRAERGMKRQGT
ncbi:MAG: RNA polymerase sigma factor, partial [Pseudomonadota bacterium]